MNWEAISAIGDLVAAIVVVVSLVYLAREVRSSTKATRATVRVALHDSEARFVSLLLNKPDLHKTFFEAGRDGSDEKRIFGGQANQDLLLSLLFNKYELFYHLRQENMFLSAVDDAMMGVIAKRLQKPAIKAWWLKYQNECSRDFVDWANDQFCASQEEGHS
jgi:hypothetical protein